MSDKQLKKNEGTTPLGRVLAIAKFHLVEMQKKENCPQMATTYGEHAELLGVGGPGFTLLGDDHVGL